MARKWEADNARADLYGGRVMGAQRATQTASFGAEAAAAGGLQHGASLLDLVKAFEKIPHARIIEAAQAHGLSLTVLRMSLAAYRIERTIGSDGLFSAPVQATQGITAGSGFATTELRVLLIDLMAAVARRWPIDAMLYVDDRALSAKGSPSVIAKMVSQATDFALDYFRALDLEVSAKKSVVVASGAALMEKIMKKFRAMKLKAVRQTKLLGVSFSGGKRRTVAVSKKRLKEFKSRRGRIQHLKGCGINPFWIRAHGRHPNHFIRLRHPWLLGLATHRSDSGGRWIRASPHRWKKPDPRHECGHSDFTWRGPSLCCTCSAHQRMGNRVVGAVGSPRPAASNLQRCHYEDRVGQGILLAGRLWPRGGNSRVS